MNAEAYLQQLQLELKGFAPEEREHLVEEIRTHIESGEADPGMGKTREERQRNVMGEMGTPKKLGHGFTDLHRPAKWSEFLWGVILPFVLGLMINGALTVLIQKGLLKADENFIALRNYFWAGWNVFFLALVMLKRSKLLTLYWLPRAILDVSVFFVLPRIAKTGLPAADFAKSPFVFMSAAILLAVLLIWLIRLIYTNRQNWMMTMFILLPFVSRAIYILSALPLFLFKNTPRPFPVSDSLWAIPSLAIAVINLVWMGIFFLSTKRDGQWCGLLLIAITSHMAQYGTYLLMFEGFQPLSLMAISITPLLIGALWWLERRKRNLPTIA
jgi:hypothetical protein